IGMILERVLAVQLNIQSSREKGPSDIGPRSRLTYLGQSREERFINGIAGLRFRLALELLLKLVEGEIQFLREPLIRWPGLGGELDDALGRAATFLKQGAGPIARGRLAFVHIDPAHKGQQASLIFGFLNLANKP